MTNKFLIFTLAILSSILLLPRSGNIVLGADNPEVILSTVHGSSIEGEWYLSSYKYFYDGKVINHSDSIVGIWRNGNEFYFYHTQGSFTFGGDGKGFVIGVGENHKDSFPFTYSETEHGVSLSVNGKNLLFTKEGDKLVNSTMIGGIYGWSANHPKPGEKPSPLGTDGKCDHKIEIVVSLSRR